MNSTGFLDHYSLSASFYFVFDNMDFDQIVDQCTNIKGSILVS